MLIFFIKGGGAKLAARLEAGVTAGSALSSRLARYEGITRGAAGATQVLLYVCMSTFRITCDCSLQHHKFLQNNKKILKLLQARGGAAAADANARKLLHELDEIYSWLDAPPLADLDSLPQVIWNLKVFYCNSHYFL